MLNFNKMSVRWTLEEEIKLLRMYREQELLWNGTSADYCKRHLKVVAINRIVESFVSQGKAVTAEDVTSRFRNIRSVFQREFKKQQESRKTETNPEHVYIPKWALYSYCDFMAPPGVDIISNTFQSAGPKVEVDCNDSNPQVEPFEVIPVYEESTSTSGCEMEASSPKSSRRGNMSQWKRRKCSSSSEKVSEAMNVMSTCHRTVQELATAMLSTASSRDIQGFCTMLGARLEMLPKNRRAALQLEFHQRLVDVEMELHHD